MIWNRGDLFSLLGCFWALRHADLGEFWRILLFENTYEPMVLLLISASLGRG